MIPNDPSGAWYTSGLRFGTPALTTLGRGRDEMREIAAVLHLVLSHTQAAPGTNGPSPAKFITEPKAQSEAQSRVAALLTRHPLYPDIALD
jgi:glycine hydroxymethyltransferase